MLHLMPMPILWRYLLDHYLKVMCLCTFAFIAILLTMRLEDIAHFATMTPQFKYILLYALYQIPYVLPIAIPVSSLISSTILIQKLSHSHEMTAMRASGIAIRDILAPILLIAVLLSALNLYIVSELATASHLKAGLLKKELRSINPLLLLTNKQLMRMQGYYFASLGSSKKGESATDIVMALPNRRNERISLIVAKDMNALAPHFTANQVSVFYSMAVEEPESFDHLMIENIGSAETTAQDFSHMAKDKVRTTISNDYLRLSLLLARIKAEKTKLQSVTNEQQQAQLKLSIYRSYTEIARRISIALAVFSFTLMGMAYGMSISRSRSFKGIIAIVALATFYLLAYFTAKGIDQLFVAAAALYLIPHLLIIGLSIRTLSKTARGVE